MRDWPPTDSFAIPHPAGVAHTVAAPFGIAGGAVYPGHELQPDRADGKRGGMAVGEYHVGALIVTVHGTGWERVVITPVVRGPVNEDARLSVVFHP